VSKLAKTIAEKSEINKEAAFDSIFNFSVGYSRTDTYERGEEFYRRRFTGGTDDEGDFRSGAESEEEAGTTTTNLGAVTVDGTTFTEESLFETSSQRENASYDSHPPGLPDYWNGSMALSKKFIWGQGINLAVSSTYRERPYGSLGAYGALYYAAEEFPYGKNPWSSSLNFGVTSPVPYCKNFGKSGSWPYVQKRMAEINTVKSTLQEKSQLNSTLAAAYLAYWDLVSSVKKLQITIAHRKRLEELAERTDRLFKEGTRTTYEKAQVDANVENMLNREEIAWTNMIAASNRLAELLGFGSEVIIFPADYTPALIDFQAIDQKTAVENALSNRPDLKAAHSDLESSKVFYEFKKNQEKLDLSFSFNFSFSQVDTYYGYESWNESVGNLFDPDTSYVFAGIQYRWPVGKKADKSALKQADIRKRQNLKRIKIKESEIITELNQVLSKLNSTENQKKQAQKNLELKEFSYQKALELREEYQQISDFELLEKYGELLEAKNAYVDALIRYQKAYIEFLSASGAMGEKI
jgi:outer membrane protein TolC